MPRDMMNAGPLFYAPRRKVRVFLSVRFVARKGGLFKYTREPHRYRAVWVVRGGNTDLYQSKVCGTEEEAVRLALKHLARERDWVDTTPNPERFGYALNLEAAP